MELMHCLKVVRERNEVKTIGSLKVSKDKTVRCFADRFWAESMVLRMGTETYVVGTWGVMRTLFV